MGKYRDHRQPRSQGFESDNDAGSSEPSYFDRRPAPRGSSSAQTSLAYDAQVLWFNAAKGFGFVKLSDGQDAFMHASKLEAAGHTSLPEGSLLKVRIEAGQKGPQVVEVVSVSPNEGILANRPATRPAALEQEGTGVVKRYDLTKGFGFIGMDDGGKDVFVHATTLARNELAALDAGQKVHVTYVQGQKGLEVRTIRLR